MTPEQFWNSTMEEICVYMECVRNKEECKFSDLHYLASLVREAVVSAFNSQVKVPTWKDVISGSTGNAEKSNIHNGWEDSKAYMMAIRDHRR